jgi:MFS family permease
MTNAYRSATIVAASFLIQAVGVGTFVSYGVFFNSLAGEFEWSRAAISGASSLAFILSGVFAIIIGRLNDSYGPRNLMRAAAVFMGAGAMLMSQVAEMWQLYVFYGVIFGMGLGAIDVIALTTMARWFTHSRGLMTGIVKVGTGAGQFSIPFIASILIATYGWRLAYIAIGAAVLIILFGVAQLLKPNPNSCNLQSATDVEHPSKSSVAERDHISTRGAIQTTQLWLICGVSVLTVFCLLIILVHIVPHASDLGLSATQSAGVLSTIGAVSMLGRFASGVTIDRTGSKPIMIVCFILLICVLFWLQMADSLWMLYLFAGIYGLAHGSFFTAISPLVAEIFGIGSHGAIFGIVVFSGTVGGSIGPIVAGQLFDITGSYTMTFRLITLMSIVGLGLILLVKPIEAQIRRPV